MDGWEADQGANREPFDVTAILAQPRQALERIAALEAELADVRAQWAADVGSAIARAMTAEAALKRVEQARDAARAEAARLREALQDHRRLPGQPVLGGTMDNDLQAEIDRLRKQLKAASEEETYLECPKCGTCYEAEPGQDYSAGVLCPECKRTGYTLVGVCHPVTAKKLITQKDWDELKAEAARLRAALESVRGDVANNERHLDIVEYINAALRGGPAPAGRETP